MLNKLSRWTWALLPVADLVLGLAWLLEDPKRTGTVTYSSARIIAGWLGVPTGSTLGSHGDASLRFWGSILVAGTLLGLASRATRFKPGRYVALLLLTSYWGMWSAMFAAGYSYYGGSPFGLYGALLAFAAHFSRAVYVFAHN